jgi:hypothetical protein
MATLRTKLVVEDAKVPEGGGLLVVMAPESGPDPKGGHDVVQPAWRFRAGKTEHVPQIEKLAPGLAIYRVPKDVTSAVLVDGKTTLGKLAVTKTAPPLLAAPQLKRLRQETRASRKGSSISMYAELAAPPPAEAVALVVADDKVARSYGLIENPKFNTVVVYSHAPCGQDPDGTVMSSDGDKLRLYWIDRTGRASPATTATLSAPPIKDDRD